MLAFVLGGGGSRGALQVGALQVLMEQGIKPDIVIGTSVGALNAAFFAADPTISGLAKLSEIWLQMNQQDIYPGNGGTMLWSLLRGQPSLFENRNMHALLLHHLPHTRFGDLALPCYAIAVDVDSGDIVAFGDDEDDLLADGLMSSTALAPAHPPWSVGQRRFLDGGFGATLPVRQAIERGATDIIALNLSTSLNSEAKPQNALEIMVHMNSLMMQKQTQCDLEYAAQQARMIVIELESDASVPISDFSWTAERMERGRTIAAEALRYSWPIEMQKVEA